MIQKTRVKCPGCGVLLDVRNSSGTSEKEITCPKCNSRIVVKFNKPVTQQIPPSNDTAETQEFHTSFISGLTDGIMGKLLYNGQKYTLQMGINSVGRKATTSKASVQIDTNDRSMSRMHSIINVTRMFDGTLRTTIKNADNKNVTYVGGQILYDSDTIVLNDGDVIKMGNVNITFVKSE